MWPWMSSVSGTVKSLGEKWLFASFTRAHGTPSLLGVILKACTWKFLSHILRGLHLAVAVNQLKHNSHADPPKPFVEYIEKSMCFSPSFSSSRIWLMVIAVSVHLAMQAITVRETSMNAPATPVWMGVTVRMKSTDSSVCVPLVSLETSVRWAV